MVTETGREDAAESVTLNVWVIVPAFGSLTFGAVATLTVGAASSSRMVPVPVPWPAPISALDGLLSVRVKVSSASSVVSLVSGTETVCVVCTPVNVTVPVVAV